NLSPIAGEYFIGGGVSIGYFDQQMAQYTSKDTVLEDYLNEFPGMGNNEARSALGAFLFSGEDVFKTVDMLSGGERVRLALCKIFKRKPNFLILDEPTNHLDMIGKETLESILDDYTGTLLFVSHDRYFVKKLAQRLIVFEDDTVKTFEYGYEEYADKKSEATEKSEEIPKTAAPKTKKSFTTPGKEKAKKERAIAKKEEKIALLEERLDGIKTELNLEENLADYMKLSALQNELETTENELFEAMAEWEKLSEELAELML
ncbi:MAG: ABC-F family ATP-binding cassette domain-containing protein, partial [Clostridia bacterium]|nr:ABC-F family ATP-binding cassette domain-containing protein [Clostridia bacterium]